ncbi:MAG: thiamine-phosphate kinase [Chloroflexi bacterium]|nr:thiamine-phosphate kinase [Chloroflexota bacterium]|tara:strand:+ start:1282 stop:2247 length:966 start_codon:yes stop_codon:yes gene_type:complete
MDKEKEFINIIKNIIDPNFDAGGFGIGIGDDAAIVKGNIDGGPLVFCSDAIVEDVHFNREHYSFNNIGWKSIAINVSDIISMGAIPNYFTVSIGINREFSIEDFKELITGMKECSDEFKATIVGGDIVRAEKLFINVSAVGFFDYDTSSMRRGMMRNSAQPGDKIGVSGFLGDSLGGFLSLQKNNKADLHLTSKHFKPYPNLSLARKLYFNNVICCTDISDGLNTELINICESSNVSAQIDVTKLPISKNLKKSFPEDYYDMAINGGEDFELLFTFNSLPNDIMDKIIVIGEVKEIGENQIIYNLNGGKYSPKLSAWRHFE